MSRPCVRRVASAKSRSSENVRQSHEGFLKIDVFIRIESGLVRVGPAEQPAPSKLAAALVAGKNLISRLWIFQRAHGDASRLNLRSGQAISAVRSLALQYLRVETAALRMFDQPVADAVERIAEWSTALLIAGYLDAGMKLSALLNIARLITIRQASRCVLGLAAAPAMMPSKSSG